MGSGGVLDNGYMERMSMIQARIQVQSCALQGAVGSLFTVPQYVSPSHVSPPPPYPSRRDVSEACQLCCLSNSVDLFHTGAHGQTASSTEALYLINVLLRDLSLFSTGGRTCGPSLKL